MCCSVWHKRADWSTGGVCVLKWFLFSLQLCQIGLAISFGCCFDRQSFYCTSLACILHLYQILYSM